jgi:hypothetical protein
MKGNLMAYPLLVHELKTEMVIFIERYVPERDEDDFIL